MDDEEIERNDIRMTPDGVLFVRKSLLEKAERERDATKDFYTLLDKIQKEHIANLEKLVGTDVQELKLSLSLARAELAALKERTRWRNFSDEWPDTNTRVLVKLPPGMLTNAGLITVALFDKFDLDYGQHGYVFFPDTGGNTCNVTHWMPLPEPPEDE